jgi:hypothetical protein
MKSNHTVFSKHEILNAFETMIQSKLKNRSSSMMLDIIGYQKNGTNTSLMAVGSDGLTTIHVLKSEKSTEDFINEIERLVNQFDQNSETPRLRPKKYKIREIESPNGKIRTIAIPCLRDQVVIRCILNRLNHLSIIDEENKPNPRIDTLIRKVTELINEKGNKKIIRTDISNFYPSINRQLLIEKLRVSHGDRIGTPIINLIEKFIDKNQTSDKYTGLPVGVGISVLLANYYVSQMKINEHLPNVQIIRYEDDFLIILDESDDEYEIMSKFDNVLMNCNLTRNNDKTKFFNASDEFDFLGVRFKDKKPSIPEERFDRWKNSVKEDIKKQFKQLKILKLIHPSITTPKNKEIINSIWRDHKKGIRSKFYKHQLRIKTIK